ncbi:aldo/keto reductase [Siphonobacter sp. SORGH_AS_1065]|uniref:aldo/keto reductase n=1 Tax=Siphonobacter sp. SORGH_AS_1065 TaxID=3041795 RepID=UPI00277DCBD3|nr:aldo/keto reductase [Siphonobacter sp. SORGH_AS_1065]MDQ1089152.1 aryl-alcohol dehydrogenase-like predicted oxidoreductase [Siphonobacter sp. SORGH_AS_1065]
MNYTRLGSSDLVVSEIAFGGMSLEKETATQLLQQAFDKGITFFDTADIYNKGENERMMGEALRSHRKDIILATKVGNQERADGKGWDWNPTKAYILESVEKSLTRLQTDYIDLYQLHGGTIEDPIDETIEAFELLKDQGKIRAYGISSIRPNVINEYVKRSNIASVMMQYSLLDRRPEENVLDLLAEHDISVLARGSVAKGLLAGKTPEPYLNYNESEVQQAAEAIKALSTAERNEAATAIRYALFPRAVAAAVVGIRTLKQLEDALKAGETTLSPEEFSELGNVLSAANYKEHRIN